MSAYNAFSVWGIRIRIDQSWFIAFFCSHGRSQQAIFRFRYRITRIRTRCDVHGDCPLMKGSVDRIVIEMIHYLYFTDIFDDLANRFEINC